MAGFVLKTIKDCIDTKLYLHRMKTEPYFKELAPYAELGVQALASATPVDTGKTAASWDYEIERSGAGARIVWTNTNVTRDGDPIAIMLQYGHGTGTGGYVQGRAYINPAIQPIFDEIAEEVWKVVTER